MRALGPSDVLALWEAGLPRQPLDRALLLCGWARTDLPTAALADLPVGAVNEALIRLRAASFGERIDVCLDCPRCGERLEMALDAGHLLAPADTADARDVLELRGYRFRAPSSRDLAAVAREAGPEAAALALLERCCVERPGGSSPDLADLSRLLAEVEDGLDALDPVADLALAVSCAECGHEWVASLDVCSLVWDEIDARARGLLSQVHVLARAYGWSEAEILELSDSRRAASLHLVNA